MALVVVVAGSWLGYQQLSGPGVHRSDQADRRRRPRDRARRASGRPSQWVDDGAEVDGTCVTVDVTGSQPGDHGRRRRRRARRHPHRPRSGRRRRGGARTSGSRTRRPGCCGCKSEASGFVPTDGKSIAQSPVVVAMPEPVAAAARLAGQEAQLDRPAGQDRPPAAGCGPASSTRPGTRPASPVCSPSARRPAPDRRGRPATVGALRALATSSSALREDLLQKFPRSPDAAAIASALSAAPLSEEDVIAYNAQQPPIQLAALYLEPAPPPLDYPFAVLPEVEPCRAAAADGLHQRAQDQPFKNALATPGLRAPDGTVGAGFTAPIGAPAPVPRPPRPRPPRRSRHRRHRRRRPRRRRDQPGARQLGGDHPARPGARRLRRLRLDADAGADGRQRRPGRR